MPTTYKHKTGARRLRGSDQLALQKEMLQLSRDGMGIPEIAATLKLAKGTAIRHLYGSGERRLIEQIIEEATIDALLILAEGMETIKLEIQSMKVKAAMGTLQLSPEQLGTFLRGMEKAGDLVKLMSGRGPAMFQELVREKKDPRLLLAQQHLEQLKRTAVNGAPMEPIEDAEEVDG